MCKTKFCLLKIGILEEEFCLTNHLPLDFCILGYGILSTNITRILTLEWAIGLAMATTMTCCSAIALAMVTTMTCCLAIALAIATTMTV